MAEAERARADARRILDGDRYQEREVPRPLRGVLRWIGERVGDLGEPVGDLLSTPAGVIIAVTVVLAGATVLAAMAARRRNRTHEAAEVRRHRSRRSDPAALDRDAEAAERAGDPSTAVRLRFRAGVLRLEEAGAVAVRADTTTRRVVASVPSPALAALGRTFDEVAYGGRAAEAADVDAARREWPAIVARAEARAGTGAGTGPEARAGAGTGAEAGTGTGVEAAPSPRRAEDAPGAESTR